MESVRINLWELITAAARNKEDFNENSAQMLTAWPRAGMNHMEMILEVENKNVKLSFVDTEGIEHCYISLLNGDLHKVAKFNHYNNIIDKREITF